MIEIENLRFFITNNLHINLLHQLQKEKELPDYLKSGKFYLEDDYFDLIDKQLGIDQLVYYDFIDSDAILYQNILEYQLNGGNLFIVTVKYDEDEYDLYFIPD
jgi:hypothetical protein